MAITLANDSDHREAIKKYYSAVHPERGGLLEDIKKKLGSNYKDAIYALFLSPVEYDCTQLKRAIKGFSTDEECVFEIICNRPHWMLQDIKAKYFELYEKELEADLTKNFSGIVGKNLVILLNTERQAVIYEVDDKFNHENKISDIMDALKYAQSPPLVKTPILFISVIKYSVFIVAFKYKIMYTLYKL